MARYKPRILFSCALLLSLLFGLVQVGLADTRAIGRIDSSPERRVALVIGNSRYDASPLKNPANDAKAMATALQRLGFEVILGRDLDQKEMKRAIWDFGGKLKADGVGLFFYAGHGVQVDGLNYLIPVQARIRSERDAELEAVDVRYVINEMARARTKLNILILDACRDNPFARSFRSGRQGLASMNAPQGTVITYATAPDQTAADGRGSHSPFTNALLKEINQPGLKLEETFKRVGLSVFRQTAKQQRPWLSSNYYGDFFFKPGGSPASPTSPPQQPPRLASATSSSGEGYGPPESTDADKLEDMLRKAEAHLKAGRLTTPKGSSAFDFYRQVLREEPANTRALDGLHRIVGAYVRLARKKIRARDWSRAENYLERAASVSETDERVLAVRDELRKARTKMTTSTTSMTTAYVPAPTTTTTTTAYVPTPTTTTMIKPSAGHQNLPKSGHNSIGINFVFCPAGSFMMGSPANHGYADERPQHKVTISQPFYIGVNEVTQEQYMRVMDTNPANHQTDTHNPVEQVTWDQAVEFCRRLTAMEGAKRYRLPTEAEWEYAARAAGKYWGPIRLSQSASLRVGKTKRNRWNIYDLAGNVWEWTADWYDSNYYSKSPEVDPQGPNQGSEKVIRGGGYDSVPDQVRSNGRDKRGPYERAKNLGFRIVLEIK